MNAVTLLCLLVALIFAAMAWLAIWSRRADRMRHAAVALFLLSLPAIAAAGLESLSWSRPIWAMWALHGDYRILGAKMIEGEGIYVYVDTDGEPRAVRLPWDARQAERLQELFDKPENQGQAMMKFEFSWDIPRPPTFYDLPQASVLPDKVPEAEAPHFDL